VTGADTVRALRRAGWQLDRVRGSHYILVHPDRPGITVTVPVHAGEILKPKTLRSILEQAGLTAEAFADLL
jgi:predicted RNA binding protein YcfA (HicA-like mRNA interferase family)